MIITDRKLWDDFILAHGGGFLQSWDWGELQQSTGRQVFRLGLLSDGQLSGAAQVIRHALPFGQSYFYCPRGPVITHPKYLEPLLTRIKDFAAEHHALFFRFEPIISPESGVRSPEEKNSANRQITNIKYQITKPVQPKQTLILDLTKSLDELLAALHPKTRYNLRLAEKRGVTVREGSGDIDFEIFWRLLKQTYSRQKTGHHPKSYYYHIFSAGSSHQPCPVGGANFQVKLYLAERGKQPLAANLVYFYGGTAVYAHGGSDHNERALMAPQLLQWRQITEAKTLGYQHYDLWGIDPIRWPGITRFKLGYGGQTVDYPGAFDLPLRKFGYGLYRLARKLR
ncbi:MAG: peptidoglycan bridge formation glycyltransferase FemA/FemB family protein [Patescibacteria group bacterium]|jgi:lipid II:glycine glycyltransferase (peptidoglycan interpeptide bridge formation enzyme)